MQTLIQIICNSRQSTSLRQKIVKDKSLKNFDLACTIEKNNNRSEGWSKIHSLKSNPIGAINIQWDVDTKTLSARVITKNKNNPSYLLADFIRYILEKHSIVIKGVNIYPVS